MCKEVVWMLCGPEVKHQVSLWFCTLQLVTLLVLGVHKAIDSVSTYTEMLLVWIIIIITTTTS